MSSDYPPSPLLDTAHPNLAELLADGDGVMVTIDRFEGSSPREVGAWMLVVADQILGTIGGGHLEFQAIAHARAMLLAPPAQSIEAPVRYALGPTLGQCCGGVVHLQYDRIAAQDAPKIIAAQSMVAAANRLNSFEVALFGGGHVGKALVAVLAALPCNVLWVDSRDEIFPASLPGNVRCEHSAPVHASVADVPAGSHVLVMSFSHAEDLDVVAACLARLRAHNDLGFIGLIGSKTKWATFRHRLASRGFSDSEIDRITCPIGLHGIAGKEPGVIAVSVAAQLLGLRNVMAATAGTVAPR